MKSADLSGSAAEIAAAIRQLKAKILDGGADQRATALSELNDLCRECGVAASAAVPLLLENLLEPGDSVTYALSYAAVDDPEPVIALLAASDPQLRRRAAEVLGLMGEKAVAAVDQLRRLTLDQSPAVREKAAWALGLTRDASSRTVSCLLDLVAQPTESDRSAGLHALGNVASSSADPALPRARQRLLFDSLKDSSARVRRWALYAIEILQLDPLEHVRLVTSQLEVDDSPEVRRAALGDLLKLARSGVDVSSHVPLLIGMIQADVQSSSTAIEILEEVGPSAREAIPALVAVAEGGHDATYGALRAVRAIWRIQGDLGHLMPVVERFLADDPESTCDLITVFGPAAVSLLPAVIRALRSDDWDTQWAAADALAAIASDRPECLDALEEVSVHDSPVVRGAVRRAFERIGEAAVPHLTRMLKTPDVAPAAFAASCLGGIGRSAVSAAPALRRALGSSSPVLSMCSAIALARITGAPDLAPMLQEFLDEFADDGSRIALSEALSALGPSAKAAVPRLELLTVDESDEVSEAARQALAAINGNLH